jgi:hypothetical protein
MTATLGLDASQYNRGLSAAEQNARMAGTRIGRAFDSGVMMPRARGMGGASAAMFVSVARDTSASLASGANPITVAMQQMPQMMQAFVMMGKEGFMSLKETLSNGLSKLVANMGGAPGVALAAAGGVTLFETLSEEFKMFGALLEESKNEAKVRRGLLDMGARMAVETRNQAKAGKLGVNGELIADEMTSVFQDAIRQGTNSALYEAIGKMVKMLPRQMSATEMENFQKVADQLRKMGIEAETDPAKRNRLRAEFERDKALREVDQLSALSGIPKEEIVGLIEKRFQADLLNGSAAKSTAIRQQMSLNALQQAGGYAAEPPGQRQIRDDLRAIRRVVEGATSDGGVKY